MARRLTSAVLVFWLAWPAVTAAVGVRIEIRAREIAPGEPIRVVATAHVALDDLDGSFLGREVFLAPAPGSSERRVWRGWTLVPLDAEPGPQVLDLQGRTSSGEEVLGTYALDVADRQYPVEELSVAPRFVSPPPDVQARLQRERQQLARVYARRGAAPAFEAGDFVRPVEGPPTSVFGTKRLYNGEPRSPHPGLDLRASTGTPVRTSGDGIVALAADLYYSGNTVIVDHGAGLFTIYAHLSAMQVAAGDPVEAGEVIGLAGATGRVTGPHLHWGAKVAQIPFDPMALLDPRLYR